MNTDTAYEERKNKFISELLETPPVKCEFYVGQLVDFTNYYGICFKGMRIIGFSEPQYDMTGNPFIYLNDSCYWFPTSPERLKASEETKEIFY